MSTQTPDIARISPLTAIERAPFATGAADEFMRLLSIRQIFMATADQHDVLCRAAGMALANRMVFACLDDNPDDERAVWVFMAYDEWAKTGILNTAPVPLQYLLPDGAQEIAEGTWMWDDAKDKTDRALALLATGFIWDRGFQKRVDATQTSLIDAIERHTPRPPAPAP